MKIFGLTGGIGCGKSTVAKIFEVMAIPVYYSDHRAKELYFLPHVKNQVIQLLGENAYLLNGQLNKKFISDAIFNNSELLQKINGIIHPAVDDDFNQWKLKQTSSFVLKEAAIIFETEIYKKLDATILVVSPEKLRIERVCKRGGISIDEVKKRMDKQLPDEVKKKLANWILYNDAENSLIKQCVNLSKELSNF